VVAAHRTAQAVRGLLDLAPEQAVRIGGTGAGEVVEAASLRIGDVVLVRPGEQIESQENLALLDPETRALLVICRDEGLRISEVLTLNTGCLKKTPAGRWALVHYKSKDRSYRAIPASRVAVDEIRGQTDRVRQRYGGTCPMAVPQGHGQPGRQVPDA
jgi:integrase